MRTLFALFTIGGLTGLAALAGWQARRAYEAQRGGEETTLFTITPKAAPPGALETGAASTLLALLVKLAKGGVTGPIAKPAVLADRAQAAALLTGFGLTKSAAAVVAGVALPSGLPADEKWPNSPMSIRDRLSAALAAGA